MNRLAILLALSVITISCAERYDVVVVGGGTGGTAAAVEAARNGAKVLVVEGSPWLGGMLTSAGVSAVDGNYRLRGGIFGEFTDSLAARYGGYDALYSGWVSKIMFNPAVGADVFRNMAEEAGVKLHFGTGVKSIGPGWKLRLDDGTAVRARILIDGSELGDVAKAVGAEALDDGVTLQDMTYVAILKEYDHPVPLPKPEGYDRDLYRNCCLKPLARRSKKLKIIGKNEKETPVHSRPPGLQLLCPSGTGEYPGQRPDAYRIGAQSFQGRHPQFQLERNRSEDTLPGSFAQDDLRRFRCRLVQCVHRQAFVHKRRQNPESRESRFQGGIPC